MFPVNKMLTVCKQIRAEYRSL